LERAKDKVQKDNQLRRSLHLMTFKTLEEYKIDEKDFSESPKIGKRT